VEELRQHALRRQGIMAKQVQIFVADEGSSRVSDQCFSGTEHKSVT
jgi:hypothetical protein